MIIALVCSMKMVHLLATGIYHYFGVLGCVAAFAVIYRISVALDRLEARD